MSEHPIWIEWFCSVHGLIDRKLVEYDRPGSEVRCSECDRLAEYRYVTK